MAAYNVITGTDHKDRLIGTSGSDDISGLEGNDVLKGRDGDDYLTSGEGNDRVYGQAGNDQIGVWIGNDDLGSHDKYFGGAGEDELFADIFADRTGIGTLLFDTTKGIFGFSKIAAKSQISGIENFSAFSSYNIKAIGGSENNAFSGGSGNDLLKGGGGDDHLIGDEGRDRIFGGNGKDGLMGGDGNDRLFGGNHADNLDGGAGFDRLFGGKGGDSLMGGAGRDLLHGGKDNARDVFVYIQASDSPTGGAPTDTVFDFVSGVDVFDFRSMDADTAAAGDQNFAFSTTGAAANSVWTETAAGGLTVMADNTGDGVADLLVFVDGVNHLDAGDFWLNA